MPKAGQPAARRAEALCLAAAAALAPAAAPSQAVPSGDTLRVSAALLRGEGGDLSPGARWVFRRTAGGAPTGASFPRVLRGALETTGAAALDPDVNPEPLRLGLMGGAFISLYKPGRDPAPDDPTAPPVGGFNLGSLTVAAQATAESDQEFDEVLAGIGAALRYTVSRGDALWPLVPAVHLAYSAVFPINSALRDALDAVEETHGRLDLEAVWHVPLGRTPLTAHADVRYWRAAGLADELETADADAGAFTSLALAYGLSRVRDGTLEERKLGGIPIYEVFLRWSTGELPTRVARRKAWMLGVVTGRR